MNTCKNCGTPIGKNVYCSLRCRNVYVNKNNRNYKKNGDGLSKSVQNKYNKDPKICPNCGGKVPYKDRKNKYCSPDCRKNALIKWNNGRKGEKRTFSEVGLENIRNTTKIRYNNNEYYLNPKYCKECGKSLEFNQRKQVFCGVKCRRKYDRRNMSKYQIYWQQCQFNFNLNEYPEEFDFTLIEQYGWYSPTNKNNNLDGVSRDHIYSIRDGFENGVDPEIIKHPANCQLMKHTDNISKNRKSTITIEDLENRIKEWNKKYLIIF